METQSNIYQKMHTVMKAVAYVQKGEKTVNGQYRFVSHDAVTAKLWPALIEAGILVVPRVMRHSQDGNRTECDIEVDFVDIDKPDDRITIPMFGFGIDPQDKGPGKAISYAVKYALLKAFSLETGDDPERDLIDHKPEEKLEEKPVKESSKTIAQVAWESMDKKQKNRLADLALAAKEYIDMTDIEAAIKYIDDAELDADEKTALWHLFDSKQRAALKGGRHEQKRAAMIEPLKAMAMQP